MNGINNLTHFALSGAETHHKGIEVTPLVSTVYAVAALIFKGAIGLHRGEEAKQAFIKKYNLTAINDTSVPRLILTLIPLIGNLVNKIIHIIDNRKTASQMALRTEESTQTRKNVVSVNIREIPKKQLRNKGNGYFFLQGYELQAICTDENGEIPNTTRQFFSKPEDKIETTYNILISQGFDKRNITINS